MQSAYRVSTEVNTTGGHSTRRLIDDNIETLKQGIDLIARLDDHLYTQPNRKLSLSGVGSHFRHCIDFYHSFLDGVEAGRINYDLRERDERLEKNRLFAVSCLNDLIVDLGSVAFIDYDKVVEALLEGASNSDWSISSLKRELQFLLSHTTHHYALIALALRSRGFEPGSEFGVAPSTLRHWRKTA